MEPAACLRRGVTGALNRIRRASISILTFAAESLYVLPGPEMARSSMGSLSLSTSHRLVVDSIES